MNTAFTESSPLRLGVMISGGGTTLANLIDHIADRRLSRVEIAVVVSSRRGIRGVEIARRAGLPLEVVRPRDFAGVAEFSHAVADALDAHAVGLVVMAGFLSLWEIPERFAGRVLNIHPALLPAFGGRGMYGMRVHRAVLECGVRESGCTVHLADNEYDHGPIVAQRKVPVEPNDTPESLAARVGAAERGLYPAVIQSVAEQGLGWLATRCNAFREPKDTPR